MASRRKRALPPWLSGVTVGKQNKQSEPFSSKKDGNSELKGESVSSSDFQSKENAKKEKQEGTKIDVSKLGKVDNGVSKHNDKSVAHNGTSCTVHEQGVGIGVTSVGKDEENAQLKVEDIVAMSYPEYKFAGSIIYSHNSDDCNIICDDILSTLDAYKDTFIGFDTEWPVTYQKGKQAKTALVQICLSVDKCYLFHISCMAKFPVVLKKLIENQSVKKVGLNVEYDLWKLEADYDIRVKSVVQNATVELKTLANQKLKTSENWSLEGLTKNVLRMRLSKDPSIRTCDWSQYPLPETQKLYAAGDAVVSLILYNKLMKVQR